SWSALLLGKLLWLIVRPIMRRLSDFALCRRRMQQLDRGAPFTDGHAASLGGVKVHVAERAEPRRVVLYLHGGGFFMHPTSAHVGFLNSLCSELAAIGVLPAYRLSPECPFPQGLDDCMSAYQALLARGVPASAIVVAGESAGGTLTLSLLMRLRDAGLPLPACAVLISPGTDLAGIGLHASYRENSSRDALVPPDALPRIVRAYAGTRDPAHPDISPLRGDFSSLPPLHFVASSSEVLRDDSVLAAQKGREAGVAVELSLWGGLMHAFPLFHRLPEARTAREDIVRFILTHTAEHSQLQGVTLADENPS
ncbi:MAG: alpha/beta hydrolase, partial [Pseudomonadota bacterium]|nr:alpha/beta hydrolase [Pseudomonadota bacterium]